MFTTIKNNERSWTNVERSLHGTDDKLTKGICIENVFSLSLRKLLAGCVNINTEILSNLILFNQYKL